MSLSQKHSGKVLVPWFNIAEWKYVYNLIYGGTTRDWGKALQILKVWKHRTPLLSAGVEGTLIILEALLLNKNLSTYENSHIFSTALVRFLNLCAANSDKQGTFYKTAMQNELPRWLVNLRHDIAHSHIVPSQSMLELSLKFCLEWLKGKYWDVQDDNMEDFVIQKLDFAVIEEVIYLYNDLNEDRIYDRELIKRIKKFITIDIRQISSDLIYQSLHELLSEEIKKDKKKSCEKICSLLINNFIILSVELEQDSGNKKIPQNFLNKWNNLINILYKAEIIPEFVCRLFNFICDDSHSSTYQETASLWIKEIFRGLLNKEDTEGLLFQSENNCLKDKNFISLVLNQPNQFTLNFLQEVLEYNNAPVEFIEDSVTLISAFNSNSHCTTDKVFTIDDLDIEVTPVEPMELIPPVAQTNSRWILIEDTSPYMNLPLGILPHQNANTNPLLLL